MALQPTDVVAPRQAGGVVSLERGLQILDLLIEIEGDVVRRTDGLSIQQAANELGVHKTTASRLIRTLVANGYAMHKDGARRRVGLGPAVQILAELDLDQQRLSEIAHPYLVELAEITGECAHAAVASGPSALVIDDAESNQALRVVGGKGRRVSLHCTSAGKCLLAYGLATIPHELPARTARTLTNPDMLRFHLAEIRERGYAVDDEENDAGVRCISAPVFNAYGEPMGCVGIDGPTIRMPDAHLDLLATHVVTTAQELSAAMAERDAA